MAVLSVLAVGGAIFYVGYDDVQTHSKLRQTTAALKTSQHTVALVNAELAHDRTELRKADAKITVLNGEVSHLNSQITRLKGTLAASAIVLTADGTEITDLKTCLAGVVTAVTDAGRGDYLAAKSELDSITRVCTAAARTLG